MGYCFCNNVALAAKTVLKSAMPHKILIVDFDVHHGNGTQDAFYDSDEVSYFSIHRFEHGKFWPNLASSNFSYIGTGKGKGFSVSTYERYRVYR